MTIRNAAAVAGVGDGAYHGFNYSALETALLATLPEIKPADLLPRDNSILPQKIATAEKRLAGIDRKITTISRRIVHEEDTDALTNIVVDLDKQRKSAKNELQSLQAQQAQPTLLESVKDLQSITWLLRRRVKGAALREARMKLRLFIGRLVERIGIVVEQPDPKSPGEGRPLSHQITIWARTQFVGRDTSGRQLADGQTYRDQVALGGERRKGRDWHRQSRLDIFSKQ